MALLALLALFQRSKRGLCCEPLLSSRCYLGQELRFKVKLEVNEMYFVTRFLNNDRQITGRCIRAVSQSRVEDVEVVLRPIG